MVPIQAPLAWVTRIFDDSVSAEALAAGLFYNIMTDVDLV